MFDQLGTLGSLILGVTCVVIGRQLVKTGYIPNPFDPGKRDFSLGPVARDALWCAVCWGGGCVWAYGIAVAVKHGYLPDTYWTAYGLMLIPILGLLAAGLLFLVRALGAVMFGRGR
jgi:hypothetical protein